MCCIVWRTCECQTALLKHDYMMADSQQVVRQGHQPLLREQLVTKYTDVLAQHRHTVNLHLSQSERSKTGLQVMVMLAYWSVQQVWCQALFHWNLLMWYSQASIVSCVYQLCVHGYAAAWKAEEGPGDRFGKLYNYVAAQQTLDTQDSIRRGAGEG
jgi:hypothetical protein